MRTAAEKKRRRQEQSDIERFVWEHMSAEAKENELLQEEIDEALGVEQ